jgi:hypothetical protein
MLVAIALPSKVINWKTEVKKELIISIHLTDRNKHWVKVKWCKKIYQVNGPPKRQEQLYLSQKKRTSKLNYSEDT